MAEGRSALYLSFGYAIFLIVIAVLLVLDSTHGLDQRYINIFGWLVVIDILAVLVFAFFSMARRDNEESYTPTIIDTSSPRGLAPYFWAKIAAAIVLTVLFVGGALLAKASIIPVIDPYDATKLISSSTLTGTFLDAGRSSIYPSVIEDTTNWVLITSLTLFFLFLARRAIKEADSIPFIVVPIIIVSSIISAFIFATAHQLAYGINGPAYFGAFLWFFVSGALNSIVGAPVSIIAHFLHNFVLVFSLGVAFSIGGIAAASNATKVLSGGIFMKRSTKKRQSYSGIIAITAILALLVFTSCTANLDIAGSQADSSGTFMPIPNVPACTTDQQCLAAVVPAGHTLDPLTTLRCNAGVCEAKFSTLSGKVAP